MEPSPLSCGGNWFKKLDTWVLRAKHGELGLVLKIRGSAGAFIWASPPLGELCHRDAIPFSQQWGQQRAAKAVHARRAFIHFLLTCPMIKPRSRERKSRTPGGGQTEAQSPAFLFRATRSGGYTPWWCLVLSEDEHSLRPPLSYFYMSENRMHLMFDAPESCAAIMGQSLSSLLS